MNDNRSSNDFQGCPREPVDFLKYLNGLLSQVNRHMERRIIEGQYAIYLELRKAVVVEFEEYGRSTESDLSELLSNTLLGMERCVQTRNKKDE